MYSMNLILISKNLRHVNSNNNIYLLLIPTNMAYLKNQEKNLKERELD